MNIHIFTDELGLYTCQTYERVNRLSPEDIFCSLVNNKPKYSNANINYFKTDGIDFLSHFDSLNKIEFVYIHFLGIISAYLIKKIRQRYNNVKFVWVFWSADFYNLPEFLPNLYLDYSKKFAPPKSIIKSIRSWGGKIKRSILNKPSYSLKGYIKAVNNIDYIACLLDEDYNNIIKFSNAKCRRLQFAYLPFDQLLPDKLSKNVAITGKKVMINHSGDPILNHFEILQSLKGFGFKNTILLTLSYGDEEYIKELSKDARLLFPNNLEIQTEFISPDLYPYKLMEVGFAIFNSKIQQGIGNIILMLWIGIKVFLREENSVYIDFKKWGFLIYSVQSDLNRESVETPLSLAEVEFNRRLLERHLSTDVVNQYYSNILSLK